MFCECCSYALADAFRAPFNPFNLYLLLKVRKVNFRDSVLLIIIRLCYHLAVWAETKKTSPIASLLCKVGAVVHPECRQVLLHLLPSLCSCYILNLYLQFKGNLTV